MDLLADVSPGAVNLAAALAQFNDHWVVKVQGQRLTFRPDRGRACDRDPDEDELPQM